MNKAAIVLAFMACLAVAWLWWEAYNAKPDPRDP
jgi:hypothetical protein